MKKRTIDRETTSLTIKRTIAEPFAQFARQNGYTVSGAVEKALIWWMHKGHKQQLEEFLSSQGEAKNDLYMDLVKDEVKTMTKVPRVKGGKNGRS